MLTGTSLTDIFADGILIYSGSSGSTVVTATDSLVRCAAKGVSAGFANSANIGMVGKMYLDRVVVWNCGYGVANFPWESSVSNVIALSNSFVEGNDYGLYNTSGNTFLSSGENHVANNGTDINGTITPGAILY